MLSVLQSSSANKVITTVAVTAAVATVGWYTATKCEKELAYKEEGPDAPFRIEVHLMDKIQQKRYLDSAKDGIPATLRILAVDLPEMRTNAFSGMCRLSHDKIFVDDIAPPKTISLESDTPNDNDAESKKKRQQQKLKIAQKSLVTSLVHCKSAESQRHVGVELLEASVENLNRFKLRKVHQVGKLKYDPGKYYGKKAASMNQVVRDGDDQEIEEAGSEESEDVVTSATHEDELEAPWNQYAWIEELKLRVAGKVPFDSPMEKSSSMRRLLFGTAYKATIPPSRRFWDALPLPKFMQSDPAGVDGKQKTNCWACHKPHAVIANGAALQRVPSSLRLLQKFCREADVPLFVIHDPRVWGGNTQQSLPEALREMRRTIKNRVIGQALKQQGSMAFSRGRLVGQVETEAKWQAKDQAQKARNMFSGKRPSRRKSEESRDWSQLDTNGLEKKLVERGVIAKKADESGKRQYLPVMVDLARRCVQDEAARQLVQSNAETSDVTSQATNV